jgi:hypothetical protein
MTFYCGEAVHGEDIPWFAHPFSYPQHLGCLYSQAVPSEAAMNIHVKRIAQIYACISFSPFLTGCHNIVQASLKLTILLSPTLESWDYRCEPPQLFEIYIYFHNCFKKNQLNYFPKCLYCITSHQQGMRVPVILHSHQYLVWLDYLVVDILLGGILWF